MRWYAKQPFSIPFNRNTFVFYDLLAQFIIIFTQVNIFRTGVTEADFSVPLLLQILPNSIAFEGELAVPDQHLAVALSGHVISPLFETSLSN